MKGYDVMSYAMKQNNDLSFTSQHFLAPVLAFPVCVTSTKKSEQQRQPPTIKASISKCFSNNQIVHYILWMMISMFMVQI